MIGKLLSSLAVFLACTTFALADPQPPQYTAVTTTSTTSIQSRQFYGVVSPATQTTVVTCYDSATLSGTIIYQGTPTPATINPIPPLGIQMTSGYVTCAIATSIVAPGYLIFWSR